jgi:hypothetical protein
MDVVQAQTEQLTETGKALAILLEELKQVPRFMAVVQACLVEELTKIAPEALVSKTYINFSAGADPRKAEPVGRLIDVFLTCLQRDRAPIYDRASYAVYDFAGSTDPSDILPGVSIASIEKLLGNLIGKFPEYYVSFAGKHWEAKQENSPGRNVTPTSRKYELSLLQAKLFHQEMQAQVVLGSITPVDQNAIESKIRPGLWGAWYGVYIGAQGGAFAEQPSCFAVPLIAPINDELSPTNDGAILLYSPARGIEKFASSAVLHRVLIERLTSPEAPGEFLQMHAIDQRGNFPAFPEVRFMKVEGDLFTHFTDRMLKNVYADLAFHLSQLKDLDSDMNAIVAAVNTVQSFPAIAQMAASRHAALLRQVQMNARPAWLKSADAVNQDVYVSLEQQLLEAEVNYHRACGGVGSLKDYVRQAVEDFISPGADERLDPDSILVTTRHYVKLASGKKIEVAERKTLTQVFMYGVHDDEAQFDLTFETLHNNSKLRPDNILRAVRSMNLRVTYNAARGQVFSGMEVVEAMRELLARQTALAMFAAVLQKHVSAAAQDVVMRYNYGDQSFETTAITVGTIQPLIGLTVYRGKGTAAEQNIHVLHAPGYPTGQEWYQFAGLKELRSHILRWIMEDEGWAYLNVQLSPIDLAALQNRLMTNNYGLDRWIETSNIGLKAWVENGPLMGVAHALTKRESSQVEETTPSWFRRAITPEQNLLNRVNTDFKALYEFSKDKLGIIPFRVFSRDLVMQKVNQYLAQTGTYPLIDPDKVWVSFHADSKISLTNLFIQWQLWRSDVSVFEKLFYALRPGFKVVGDIKEQLRTATFWHADKEGTVAGLTANVVGHLIDLRPAEKYAEYLRARFLNVSDIDLRVDLYRKLKQNEMLRAALTQKMKADLLADEFYWLRELIEGLSNDVVIKDNYIVGGAPGVGVYEFTLEGRSLQGAYVFGREINGRAESIIYVPNTFDGRDFFPARQLAARLESPLFQNDVLKLTRLEDLVVVKNLLAKYSHNKPGAEPAPVLKNSYRVYRFKSEYQNLIARFLADVDFQTTSPTEAFWRDARILIEFAVDVVSLFIPPVGLVASLLRITRSVIQGIAAASQGDEKAANSFFASAWRGAISLYIGKVAAVGAPVSAIGLLSNIKDIAELVSAATGVQVGIDYLTAVVVPQHHVESQTRLLA